MNAGSFGWSKNVKVEFNDDCVSSREHSNIYLKLPLDKQDKVQ